MNIKKYFIFLFIFFICSCSNTISNREASFSIYNSVMNKNYQEALQMAQSDNFYSDENSKLLKLLDIATLQYLNKNFYQSLKYFEKAKELSDNLYTKSLSRKALSAWDANLDIYYGETYELSLIRFYISLVNYNIYQQGFYEEYIDENGIIIPKKELTNNEKLFHLNYARSIIIEWDSFLKSIQNEEYGEAKYKNDLLAKIWGSFIHLEFNDKNDNQIALQLYKDIDNVLLQNYNMYSIFNQKYSNFNKDFKKLSTLNYRQLYTNYIEETNYSRELQEYANKNIRNLQKNRKDNLVVLVKNNLISPKTVKQIEIPFPLTMFGTNGGALYEFAQIIMLTNGNIPYILVEIPEININKNINQYRLDVYDLENNQVATTNLVLVEPLSYIAKKELEDKIVEIQTKIISRITTKYLAAIAASYSLYNQDNSMSKFNALLTFQASSKLINETSRADIRYWITLLSDAQIGGIILPNGKYIIKIIQNNNEEIYQEEIEINNNTKFIDLNF